MKQNLSSVPIARNEIFHKLQDEKKDICILFSIFYLSSVLPTFLILGTNILMKIIIIQSIRGCEKWK